MPAETDAARWLARLLRVLARDEPALAEHRFRPHPPGLVVVLPLLDCELLFQSRDAARAWTRTASFAVSIRSEQPMVEGLSGTRRVLQVLRDSLARADPGDLVFSAVPTGGGKRPVSEIDHTVAAAAHAELADTLHRASFLAWKVITTEDLYPHVGTLGQPLSHRDLLDGWDRTLARLRKGAPPDRLGLYVHVPFCTVACTFCYCGKTDRFDRGGFDTYLSQLLDEAEGFREVFEGARFTSAYFGGGTPSLLSPPAMSRLFQQLHRCFDIPAGTQVIYEGNPDSLSERKIEVMATEGQVTRLTIGVQTLDDRVQARVRRHNKPQHVADAVAAARKWGIRHVNTDLMAGLPEQTLESFQQDLEYLLSLEPDSIHLNAFRPLPRVALARQGLGTGEDWIRLRNEMMAWATDRLSAEGHTDEHGGGQRRSADAANLQEYDLRRQNSSLLGLGFPARAHAFGSYFYAPDRSEGFDPALQREISGKRRWVAVPSHGPEEAHKYLVANFRTGFDLAEFEGLFGCQPEDVAGEALEQLTALGVVRRTASRVETHGGTHGESLVYRTLLYSPAHRARAIEVWGAEYDPAQDYSARLRELVESFNRGRSPPRR